MYSIPTLNKAAIGGKYIQSIILILNIDIHILYLGSYISFMSQKLPKLSDEYMATCRAFATWTAFTVTSNLFRVLLCIYNSNPRGADIDFIIKELDIKEIDLLYALSELLMDDSIENIDSLPSRFKVTPYGATWVKMMCTLMQAYMDRLTLYKYV